MTDFKIEPLEALMVIRAMLQPGGGRAIYQVRGVEVTKDQCLDVLDALVNPKHPKVDVLSEAFRVAMRESGEGGDYIEQRLRWLREAVDELSTTVERVAKKVLR